MTKTKFINTVFEKMIKKNINVKRIENVFKYMLEGIIKNVDINDKNERLKIIEESYSFIDHISNMKIDYNNLKKPENFDENVPKEFLEAMEKDNIVRNI